MVLDSSAIVAILLGEPEAKRFENLIAASPALLISAGTLIETGIVIDCLSRQPGTFDLDYWLLKTATEIVPVDATQAAIARRAYTRYGKGRHPAGLNFGDCFAYALAIARSEPLLFKGNDFSKTDAQICHI